MEPNPLESSPPREISLEELLAAREARAAYQQELMKRYPGASLVCLTVNAPGPVKRTPLACRVFAAGMAEVERGLAQAGLAVVGARRRMEDTGGQGYFLVEAAGETVKRILCKLEENLPYGRLLDLDVHTPAGQISRTRVGHSPRGCMVCGKPGPDCASRRLHPLPEVLAAFEALAILAPEEEE